MLFWKWMMIIFLLISNTVALSENKFSNLIIFGDSLSDSGNFPETQFAFHDLRAPKTLKNSTSNFYVPFSNPVNKNNKKFTPISL